VPVLSLRFENEYVSPLVDRAITSQVILGYRRGFLGKVARTSVLRHYGLRTLSYGVLLPAPDIGRAATGPMRQTQAAGHECGIHTWDHVVWQDHVRRRDAAWTREVLQRSWDRFGDVFGRAPATHGAAGWQANEACWTQLDAWACATPRTAAAVVPTCRCCPPTNAAMCSCRPRWRRWTNAWGSTAAPSPTFTGTCCAPPPPPARVTMSSRCTPSWRGSCWRRPASYLRLQAVTGVHRQRQVD
jgi:hypothetical protein